MILLFDRYDEQSLQLHTSVLAAGTACEAFVCIDDGFLPADVISPYRELSGNRRDDTPHPVYFDRIKVPVLWEIRDIGGSAEIYDYTRLRGRINYAEPRYRRFISSVDWLDEKAQIRCRDHYDQWGARFAETIFDPSGKMVLKRYFNSEGQEIIVENLLSGEVILRSEKGERFFRSRTDFMVWFLCQRGLERENILYNSLSTPFFVSERLGELGYTANDALYWHEEIKDQAPGNMRRILDRKSIRTHQIFALRASSMVALHKAKEEHELFRRLGYVPPFFRDNAGGTDVLIMTNSDQVEALDKITEALPKLTFHVAAITAMSNKLLAFSRKNNVRLYPNVQQAKIEELYETCDYYLDINWANEIENAVQRAFFGNQLILAFTELCHRKEYVRPECRFSLVDSDELIARLRELSEDPEKRKRALDSQRCYAMAETPESFRHALISAGLINGEDPLKKKSEEPQVFFCMHDNNGKYARNVGAAMQTVIWSASRPVCFHIVHDDSLTEDNRQKLCRVAETNGHRIQFHDCRIDNNSVDLRHYTVGSLYRLMIPELCPELDRAIYLDADIMVNLDVTELWDTDLRGCPLAAVREPGTSNLYYNAGVLYMDLKRLRADGNFLQRCLDVLQESDAQWPDQDAMNILYAEQILPLERKWNTFCGGTLNRVRELRPCIFHYAASFINLSDPTEIDQKLLRAYAATPWADNALPDLYRHVTDRQNDLKMVLSKFVSRMGNDCPRKIYCDILSAPEPFRGNLLTIFPPREGDRFVEHIPDISTPDGVKADGLELLSTLVPGEDLIIIRPVDGYEKLCEQLRAMGMQEQRDYFNALRLLTRNQGGYA